MGPTTGAGRRRRQQQQQQQQQHDHHHHHHMHSITNTPTLLLLLLVILALSCFTTVHAHTHTHTPTSQFSQVLLGKSAVVASPWKVLSKAKDCASPTTTSSSSKNDDKELSSSSSKERRLLHAATDNKKAAVGAGASFFSGFSLGGGGSRERTTPEPTFCLATNTNNKKGGKTTTTTENNRRREPRRSTLAAAAAPSSTSTSFRVPSLPTFRLPALHINKTLTFWGNMVAGAISRSCAQTAMHPANVVKTLLQTKGTTELQNLNFRILTRGAGAQFALSIPHGAIAFAVLEATKTTLSSWFPVSFAGPAFDFVSSAVSTTLCSVISTPQMVLTDRIMAGYYPNLIVGVKTVLQKDGIAGLYAGWFAALAQKIPSYGLTWVFFQQLKQARTRWLDHDATHTENFGMGAFAAAATVCVMIPLDTVKTRIVTQAANPAAGVHYKGVADCFMRVLREEGLKTFYAPLAPRLVSVVPMIGIQFGVYEAMKRFISKLPEREVSRGKKGKVVPSVAPERESSLSEPPLSELFDEIEDSV